MFLADGVQAQTNACDQLKGVFAARIDASGVRGYSLETVPAGTPAPPDAKAIGTCEAGAYKILYRRWGATRPSSGGASAAGPASAPQVMAVPDEPTRRSPGVQGDRVLRPVAASAPSPKPQPIARSNEAVSAVPTPAREPEKPLGGSASEVEAARANERAVVPPAPAQPARAVVAKVPLARQASEFMAENWRWIWALFFLPIAAWVWAWRAHRSAYDEAGLPRGPKL